MTATCPSRLVLDAWVEHHVHQIDQEIYEHDDDGDEHHQVLHDRVVTPADGLDEEACHAGDVEYRLGDDQSTNQERSLDADDRDHRQHRIAQCMLVVDGGFRSTLRTCSADVVLTQHFQHG